MAVVAALFQDHLASENQLFSTSITTAIYALLALLAALVIARHPRTGWIALALLMASYLSWLVLIWVDPGWRNDEPYRRVIGLITVPAAVLLHIGVLTLAPLRATLWRVMRIIVAGCSVGAGLIILALIAADDSFFMNDGGVLLGVLILLALFGTVMVPVAGAIERSTARDTQESDLDLKTPVSLTCPRCSAAARIDSNTDATCPACALRIRVTIEEPRCDCGYLLYNLDTGRCPECGEPDWTALPPPT